jgi:ubiquinone/menaquinone biosynthesis C-methylase UbiE
MNNTKEEYTKHADRIWEKRFNSPFLIRRYLHRAQYNTILKYIEKMNPPPKLILDYGCGEGVLSVLIGERGFNVIGMDISIPNIIAAKEIIKKRDLKIDFIIGDGENLPFEDKSFDLVVASHVLEHLPNIEKSLREIKRVANKAIIAVPTCLGLSSFSILGGDSPWTITRKSPFAFLFGFLRVIKNINREGVIEKYAGKNEFPHLWFYPWKFRRILEDNGFKILHVEASSLCSPYISYIFPKTIEIFKFIDRFKDRKVLNYFGYGTTYVIEVKK